MGIIRKLFGGKKNKQPDFNKMAKKVADLVAEYNAIQVPRRIKIIIVK